MGLVKSICMYIFHARPVEEVAVLLYSAVFAFHRPYTQLVWLWATTLEKDFKVDGAREERPTR